MSTHTRPQRIKVLERRAEHLRRRLGDSEAARFTYDAAELRALDWAIGVLKVWLEDQRALGGVAGE